MVVEVVVARKNGTAMSRADKPRKGESQEPDPAPSDSRWRLPATVVPKTDEQGTELPFTD